MKKFDEEFKLLVLNVLNVVVIFFQKNTKKIEKIFG